MKPSLSLMTSTLALLVFCLHAKAETPPCYCSADTIALSISEELACFEVAQDDLDVCYGDDVVIRVTNTCDVDVVVTGLAAVSGSTAITQTVAAGSEDSWQERFEPMLRIGTTTEVTMAWTLDAEGVEHSMELSFTGSCVEVDVSPASGCRGAARGPLTLSLLLLAGGAAITRRRRARLT